MRIMFVLLVMCGFAVGCTSGESGASPSDVAGEWRLTAASVDDQPLAIPEGRRALLSVTDRQVLAHSPCLPYFGVIASTDTELTLKIDRDAVFAGVGCGAIEDEFSQRQLDTLTRVDNLALNEQGHLIASAEGVELLYEPLDPVPEAVFDRDWTLVSWRPSHGTHLVPAVAGASLRIDSDGTFEGESGCNRWFAGTWEVHLDGLRFPRFDIEAPCPGEPLEELVDQHGKLTAIGIGVRPLVIDDQLHLITTVGINDTVSFVFE